jgi:hypothetical protein
MPDPKAPVAPAAKAPVVPAANPPPAAPAALAIDERFAALAADFMSQVDAKIETLRQEFATQFGLNVDPLHKDLHDLLDLQTQLGVRVDKLEAADFVTPEGLQEQAEHLADQIAQKIAPTIQPTVQPVINVTPEAIRVENSVTQSLEERVRKLEGKLKHF